MFNRTHFKKFYRAKTQRKITWRALPFDLAQGGEFIEPRLCGSHFFSDSAIQKHANFNYVWLAFFLRRSSVAGSSDYGVLE
jgi:hypothetical protein